MVISSRDIPWFCEFGSNKLASIDPETMEIHEHVLPNDGSRPRRIAITPDDVIWYSDYARGYLGRFDTKTGDVKEFASPGGPNSLPYGIVYLKKCSLVQRIRRASEHAGPLRSGDREVPDLADPFGWRRRAQHDGDARRQHRDGRKRREPRWAGRGEVVGGTDRCAGLRAAI